MEKNLKTLTSLSRRFGTLDFVIAGGGNTSFKTKEFIWVKASEKKLSTITEEDFVQLNRSQLNELSSRTYNGSPYEIEKQAKSDLLGCRFSTVTTLRPSVETSVHNFINYSFVVHTHPAIVNGVLCSKNAQKLINELFPDDVFLDYADPGYTLFKKIEEAVIGYRVKNNCDPKIIFIANHGLFVSANSADEIELIYKDILERIGSKIKNKFPIIEKNINPLITGIIPAIRSILSGKSTKILKVRNNSLISRFIDSPHDFAGIQSPFTLDNTIYCKGRFLYIDLPETTSSDKYIDFVKSKYEEFVAVNNYEPKIIVLKNLGIVASDNNAESAEAVLDIFEDMMKISLYSENFGGPKFMLPEEIRYIENRENENIKNQESNVSKINGKIEGKIAIVTGGSQGFGEGIVRDFFKQGANVIIADIKIKEGKKLAEELNSSDKKNKTHFVETDVSDFKSLEKLLFETVKNFGGLDIVISNAGILRAGSIEDMNIETFELVTKINYTAYFQLVKAVVPVLKLQTKYNPGLFTDIIQINSKSGLRGSNKNFAYAGGKFGGVGLTQSFALELINENIKVNSICPGNFFDGPLWSDPVNGLFVQYLNTGKVPGAKTIDDVKRFYEMQVPAQRGCRIEDVMKAIYYVIEQEYETGQAIPVTGGQVMMG